MQYLVIFIWGVINFVISWLDDFVVLIHLFRKYSTQKKYVVIGTLLALMLVLFISYFFGNILIFFIQEEKILFGLLPFGVGLYKAIQYDEDDSEEEEIKMNLHKKIFTWFAFWEAMFIFLINATDDTIFYSSYFINSGWKMNIEWIFTLWVFFGAFVVMYIAKDLWKYIEKWYLKINAGKVAGWVLMWIGTYMILLWVISKIW